MFTENKSHVERNFFDDMLLSLPESKREKALKSAEYGFYKEVFLEIDEKAFRVLFDNGKGRPNAAVNCMVAALVLRQLKGLTYEQLMENIDFNVLTRLALGLTGMEETPFCAATLFNFQNRMVEHEIRTGENLFEKVFHSLTAKQVKRYGVSGAVQRSDSFQALSNVARYGQLRLMIEVLRRLYRRLEEEDRERLEGAMEKYGEGDAYVYGLKDGHLPVELGRLAKIYGGLYDALGDRYAGIREYENFARLYRETVKRTKRGFRIRERKEIGSGSLQSPDDPDATYSRKNGKHHVGHKVNVTETADPSNEVNLLTDVAVDANNVGDGPMLAERMAGISERHPELEEMHTDGAYGGEALDPGMKEHGVLHVETGSNAAKARVPMRYDKTEEGGYLVTCAGGQTVSSAMAKKRFKAVFDKDLCEGCPHSGNCQAKEKKTARVLYFEESWAKSSVRSRNIEKLPEERRRLRANVEATVKEFSAMFNHKGKMPVRGRANTRIIVLSRAMAINFGRIFRYQLKCAENGENTALAALDLAKNACSGAFRLLTAKTRTLFGIREPEPLKI